MNKGSLVLSPEAAAVRWSPNKNSLPSHLRRDACPPAAFLAAINRNRPREFQPILLVR